MKSTDAAQSTVSATRQKDFDLGDILSITTGRLVSPRKIGGVYDILNYMTGESLFTHQLVRASKTCKPELLRQHPQLADIDTSSICDPETAMKFLGEQKERFGAALSVQPLAEGVYTPCHPIQELVDMGAKNIIATDGSPESVDALVAEIKGSSHRSENGSKSSTAPSVSRPEEKKDL